MLAGLWERETREQLVFGSLLPQIPFFKKMPASRSQRNGFFLSSLPSELPFSSSNTLSALGVPPLVRSPEMYAYIKWNTTHRTGVVGTAQLFLRGDTWARCASMWRRQRGGPECSLVAAHISCVSSVTENLEFTSDFYRSKSLATLCLPIGSLPGGTFSKNGGRGREGDKKFKLPTIHHKTKWWGGEERQAHI